MPWDAANARARGLATHLLDRDALLRAADAGSWQAAIRTLVEQGYPLHEAGSQLTPGELDRATGRLLAARLALLGRWLGPRKPALAVLYEEAEYRALRRLLRGAAQGASPGARLRGTTPTPGLPARALESLAHVVSPAQLAESLVRLGHPAGRALQAGTGGNGSELWRCEAALARLFAQRATRAARTAGRAVRQFAAMLIDLANAEALLLREDWGPEVSAEDLFLHGGRVLDLGRFVSAAKLGGHDPIAAALREWFTGTPLQQLFVELPEPRAFEAGVLRALLAWQRQEGSRDPLGPGVVLGIIERMRAEAHDVRLVSSAAELGAPRDLVEAALVTAA